MKRTIYLPLLILILTVIIFFKPYFFQGKLPVPADTIIGLYHPFRDFYANEYPNGIPYKNFLVTDPVRQQYPWRTLSVDSLKQSNLPLWNPYTMAGTPLLANFQSAAFYPLNILFFLFPFSISWSILVMLQPILASVFLYLYLRYMKISVAASWLGSITFAFGGFATSWMEWNTLMHVVLWLPLILLAKENLFNKFSYKWIVILIFAYSASFFAGHLQTFLYVMFVSGAYFIARSIQLLRKEKRKNVLTFAFKKYSPFLLAGIGILLITAIQWIPGLQLINLSARGVDQINGWQQPGWFIPWQHLVQFVAPDFFGNPATLNYWGEWNYGEFVGYVGILPLIMAFFAIISRHDKKTWFFGLMLLLSLIFALPTFFAKIPYQLELPFLSTSQPTRLLFVTNFSLAVLAALGFDYMLKTEKKLRIIFAWGLVASIFLGLWLFVLFSSQISQGILPENIAVAKRNLYIPTFFLLITTVIISALILNASFKRLDKVLNRKLLGSLLVIFLLVITALDLFRFFEKFTPFTDKAYLFPSTKAISFLKEQEGQFRIMSTDSRILPPNFSIMYKLQSLDGYDPLYLLRYGELQAAIKRDKPDISPPFGFNRIVTQQKVDSPIIDLMGVQYILSMEDMESPKLRKVFTEGKTRVYKNNQAFPRSFFVDNIIIADNKQKAIEALFDTKINLRNTAIAESIPNDFQEKKLTKGNAEIISYSENKIVIKTSNTAEGFLVLMDTFYPTWNAQVCNTRNEECTSFIIVRTNYNFRGIFVPAGNHHIVFYNGLL